MRKFKIPAVPGTTPKTIRFPNEVVDAVEDAVKGSKCNFSQFVIEATRVALDNLKEDTPKEKES